MTDSMNGEKLIALLQQIVRESRTVGLDELEETVSDPDEAVADHVLLEKLIPVKDGKDDRDGFWETIIPVLSPASFSDKLLSYLYENKIAVIELCHKELPDAWLEKLAVWDNAPVYVLVRRYFDNRYTEERFGRLAEKHIVSNASLYSFILDRYPLSEKLLGLLRLGMMRGEQEIRDLTASYFSAVRSAVSESPEEIVAEYRKHKSDSRVLLGIALNPYTPGEILRELTEVSGCKNAKVIRIRSAGTLKSVQKRASSEPVYANADFCCEDMTVNIRDCKTVLYNEVFDEYGLAVPGDEHSVILLRHCPWCGKRLPESKRELWFDELEAMGFDAPLVQEEIPEEYRCARWREKV